MSTEKQQKILHYLEFYYKRKQMIAKCFTKLCFSAGACSTQRAESINSIIKRYIKLARRTSFLKLVDCLEHILDHENFDEANIQRMMKTKTQQINDPIQLVLSKQFSPYICSKIMEQLMM